MALSEIVDVTIQVGTASPTRRGFGQILFLSYGTEWTDLSVRRYSTYSAVLEDFTDSDKPEAKAAAAFFSQKIRPRYFKIARMPAPAAGQLVVLDGTNLPTGTSVVGSIVSPDGTATAINVAWNTNLATTMTDLATAITAISGLTGSSNATSATSTTDAAGAFWFFDFSATPTLRVRETTADWGLNTRLDQILLVDTDFYAVAVTSNSPKNMDKVARWALANERLALFAPQYTDPTQFVSGEFTAGADHTALLANDAAVGLFTESPRSAFMEVAWAANLFATDPGSATWAFKSLEGIGADDWSTTQRGTIETTNHGNHYTTEAGIDITRPGKCFGGEFIDVVIGLAWLKSRIQERIFGVLVNNPKVPYTDAGVSMIAAEVRGQLQEAEQRDVLAPGESTVTTLAVADQDPADRADRILRGVEFSARLAGAVHDVRIVGTVTV